MDQSQRNLLRITQIGFFFFFLIPAILNAYSPELQLCVHPYSTHQYTVFCRELKMILRITQKLLSTGPLETIQKDTATCIRKQDDVQWVSELELGIIVTHSCHKDCHLHRAMYRLQKLWNFSTLFQKTFLKHWEIHIRGSITVAHEMKRTEKYITRLCFSETYPVTFPLY